MCIIRIPLRGLGSLEVKQKKFTNTFSHYKTKRWIKMFNKNDRYFQFTEILNTSWIIEILNILFIIDVIIWRKW